MIDWAWAQAHLDVLGSRLVQHLLLAAVAVGAGFGISFPLAVWSVRHRRVYPPVAALAGILYTIPSLALFAALVPITGLSPLTAEVPLVLYTLVIFVRNIVAGFDAVPADAGLRVASVSTIGLVTISGAIGDRFGGLGFFIFEGWRHSFATEMLFGAVPSMLLAVAVDLALVAVARRVTPWARAGDTGAAAVAGAT